MSNDAAYQRLALRIFLDFGGTIGVPAVLGALLGRWLDGRYGTNPRYTILCLMVALILTAISIAKKAKRYGSEFERLNKSNQPPTSPKL